MEALSLFISAGLREKNATSEPDINAEANNRNIKTTIPIIVLKSGGLTVMPDRSIIFAKRFPGSN